jgi:hypothetical protein
MQAFGCSAQEDHPGARTESGIFAKGVTESFRYKLLSGVDTAQFGWNRGE